MTTTAIRLTQYAHGGGCACKIPPGELENMVRDLVGTGPSDVELLVGLDHGDDAAAVRLSGDTAILSTTDFFTPVVDDGAVERGSSGRVIPCVLPVRSSGEARWLPPRGCAGSARAPVLMVPTRSRPARRGT